MPEVVDEPKKKEKGKLDPNTIPEIVKGKTKESPKPISNSKNKGESKVIDLGTTIITVKAPREEKKSEKKPKEKKSKNKGESKVIDLGTTIITVKAPREEKKSEKKPKEKKPKKKGESKEETIFDLLKRRLAEHQHDDEAILREFDKALEQKPPKSRSSFPRPRTHLKPPEESFKHLTDEEMRLNLPVRAVKSSPKKEVDVSAASARILADSVVKYLCTYLPKNPTPKQINNFMRHLSEEVQSTRTQNPEEERVFFEQLLSGISREYKQREDLRKSIPPDEFETRVFMALVDSGLVEDNEQGRKFVERGLNIR